MEAVFLDCGAGGPQLKRNPLGRNPTRTVRTPALALTLLWPFWPTLHAQGAGCDTAQYTLFATRESAPPRLWKLFRMSGLVGRYDVDVCHLNPFYLAGDFDGDGHLDFAIRLRNTSNTDYGRLVVLRGNGSVAWLTPDSLLRFPGPGAWYVHLKTDSVGQGVGEGAPPKLRGDAIMMIKPETSSALVYWNGRRFVSYWQGD